MVNHKPYLGPEEIQTIAVIGTGSVGASWIALFLARGFDVVAQDPATDAKERACQFISDAWPGLRALGATDASVPPLNSLRFVATAAEAATCADMIQENVPEKPEVKAAVLAEIDAAATAEKIIISSTGGIPPTDLQEACAYPERFVVIHPFNPSHLIPLVEVVAGKKTAPEVAQWAMAFSRHVGKQPIFLKKEAIGHMTNRLQFALLREAVHCLIEEIASAEDIDAAVRYGLGPRWTLMGSLLTLHLAGGAGGMAGILDHAGNAIESWWSALGNPALTPAVRKKLIEAGGEVAKGTSINEWTQWRDEALTKILQLQECGEQKLTEIQVSSAFPSKKVH
jgi:carnitine 3-dehydrogenase